VASGSAQVRGIPAIGPILFEQNHGQAPGTVRYLARARGYRVQLESTGIVFDFGSNQGRLTFRSAKPSSIRGESQARAIRNYYLGSSASEWQTAVPTYNTVRYRELWQGIDLVFRASPDLEFDLALDPGAEPELIEFQYEGFRKVDIDAAGDLLLEVADGVLRQHSPDVFQDGRRIRSRYVRRASNGIGIVLDSFDHSRPVLIDPRLTYASYLGGGSNEALGTVVSDAEGNYYVAGITDSTNFPSLPAGQTAAGNFDLAISKFDRNHTLIYSTILGGSASENVFSAVALADGTLYLAAATASTNFPRATGSTLGNGIAGTGVVRLSPTGSLNGTAFVPAPSSGAGFGIALDGNRNVWITGGTTGIAGQTGSIQASPAGGQDVFIMRINAALAQVTYFTYLGTPADENGTRIVVDAPGNVYVSGNGGSAAFPTGPSPAFPAAGSFVLKIDPAANRILFATYLSGGGGGGGLVLDGENLWVCVNSTGSGFAPTPDAMQSSYGGGATDAALVSVHSSTGRLRYASYHGGSGNEFANHMVQDNYGNLVLIGTTLGAGTPVSQDALQPTFGGGTGDAFVLVVDGGGRRVYASNLGGSGSEAGAAVAVDPLGNVIAVGSTTSANFPVTPGAFQTRYTGTQPDIFIAHVEMAAAGDPSLARTAVQNAASFRGGPVAPGEIVTLYPRNAGPPALVTAALTAERRIATVIGGTRVLFDEIPAPMVYAVNGQISAVAPYEIGQTRQVTRIVVEFNGVRSRPVVIPVTATAPGIFTAAGGTGQAAAVNENQTFNTEANPAARGSILVFFATGEGQTNPAGVNGRLNEFARFEDFPRPIAGVTVTLGGQPAEILYAGGAPGFLAGLMQFNIRVPQVVTAGNAELLIAMGGVTSAPGVTVAVQ
jgi:uncharacterized protein (TIGR03437 family)